mgnify:CR=1 FL=1
MFRRSYAHTYGECNYHYQFTPKYRRKVFLYREVRAETRKTLKQICSELNITLVAVEFGPDHCHVFLAGCKNYAVSYLAARIKGRTSIRIRNSCCEQISGMLWGNAFWTRGYFHETVGSVTADARRFYIERCQGKHWDNAVLPDWQSEIGESVGQKTLSNFGCRQVRDAAAFRPQ